MAEKSISVRLGAKVDAYVAGMKRAKAETTSFSRSTERNLKQVGSNMQTVGRRMTTMVSLPIAAAGAFAVKAAVDWESAWAGVTKTVDGTVDQMASLEQGLRDMTKELPASHAEIAAVAEAAGQLGVGVADIEDFTRVMIDLGETTNLSADEAATTLARFMNIMGTSQDEVSNLGSTIVGLGNNFAATEQEIATLGTRLAAAGRQAGLSESDVLAFAAALSSVGIEAEAGGTAFSKVFAGINTAVIDGGEKLETFARVAGVSSEQFRAAFEEDAASAIAMFIEGIGGMAAAGQSTTGIMKDLGLGSERTMRAVLSLGQAGGVLTEALAMGGDEWERNTALTDEANKRYETTAARFEMVRNKIVDLFIDLGQIILPVVESVVNAIGSMADTFQSLPRPLQTAGVAVAGLVAAIGPLVFIGGTLVKSLVQIRAAVGLVGTAMPTAGRAVGTMSRGLGVMSAVAAAAYAAFQILGEGTVGLADNWDDQEKSLGSLTDEMVRNIATTGEAVTTEEALSVALSDLGMAIRKAAPEDVNDALATFNVTAEDTFRVLNDIRAGGRQGAEVRFELLTDALGGSIEAADYFITEFMTGNATLEETAEVLGITEGRVKQLATSWDVLNSNAIENLDIADDLALKYLDQAVALGGVTRAAVLAAEAENGVARNAQNASGIFQLYVIELAKMDPAAAQAALSMDGVSTSIEEMSTVAASSIDTLTKQQEAFEATQRGIDFFAEALDMALGGAREWVRAHDGFAQGLRDLDDAIDDGTNSLDANTDAGLKNRSAVFDLADDLLRLTESNIAAGKSQDEVNAEYLAGREALLDAAEAAGLNRDEVNELISEYGLVPELVTTSIQLKNTALQQWRIQQYLDDLNEIPEELATQITAAIDSGDLDYAEYLLNQWKYRQDLTLRYKIVISNPYVSVSSSAGGSGIRTTIQAVASARGRYVDQPTLSTLGEGGRPEVVLPLTNLSRMATLLADSRVGAPVAAAMSMVGGGSGDGGTTYTFGDINVGTRDDAATMVDALDRAMFLARYN